MAKRIDVYRLRRAERALKAYADLDDLRKHFKEPIAALVRQYAEELELERKRRKEMARRMSSVFARMARRYGKALAALQKRALEYNATIAQDDKLEELVVWESRKDFATELRSVLTGVVDEPPSPEDLSDALLVLLDVKPAEDTLATLKASLRTLKARAKRSAKKKE